MSVHAATQCKRRYDATRTGAGCRVRPTNEVLLGYLARAPLAHAVFRASELMSLAEMRLASPVLDVGCGAGEFSAAAVDGTIDVGVDVCPRQIRRARQNGGYRNLIVADAVSLPFPDETFQTVLSISVVEHLVKPNAALHEMCRVLRPGGTLVLTIVLAELHQQLAMPERLRNWGLRRLADWYGRFNDLIFRHRSLLPMHHWQTWCRDAGIDTPAVVYAVPRDVVHIWERNLFTAWPYRLLRPLLVNRCWRPSGACERLAARVRSAVSKTESTGACAVIVGRKGRLAGTADER